MTTTESLANRVRSELGDIGKTFVHQITADGTTNRFQLPYAPVDGLGLTANVNGTDVSNACEVEEHTGIIVFDNVPPAGAVVIVAGIHYRYFTNDEIERYVCTALEEHNVNSLDVNGRPRDLSTLPHVDEYPVVLLAVSHAMMTLATDASFDINIFAPDGVTIPRSERYRQLTEMAAQRREQYKELCSQLGLGMYRIENFTLRRISQMTGKYVPVCRPQEIDDRSFAERVNVPIPTYGDIQRDKPIPQVDIKAFGGLPLDASVFVTADLETLGAVANIRHRANGLPVYQYFTVTVENTDVPGTYKVCLTLTPTQTRLLPERMFWDLELVADDGSRTKYVGGQLFTTREVQW